VTELGPDRFQVRVDNRKDDCSEKPKKPTEMDYLKGKSQHLEFVYPHIWENYITDKMRIQIAFVPVDDSHTILYMRVYQKVMRVPLLAGLVNWLMKVFSLVVAHQDRRVVQTQRPFPSSYKSDEKLVQGDHPIVHYRKRRDELKIQK
jgi:phenylpropionate dioxygenase-like ring-hydroxylating dioxygenase large terminal subunit